MSDEPVVITDPQEERVAYLERFTEESKADRAELHRALRSGRMWRTVAWVAALVITVLGFQRINAQQDQACEERAQGREAVRDLVRFVISFNPESDGAQRLTIYLRDNLAPITCE